MKDQIVRLCQTAFVACSICVAVFSSPGPPQSPAEERSKRIQEYGPEDLFPNMREKKKVPADQAVGPKRERPVLSPGSQKPPAAAALSSVPAPATPATVDSKRSAEHVSTPALSAPAVSTKISGETAKPKSSRALLTLFLFGMVLSVGALLFLIAQLKRIMRKNAPQALLAATEIEAAPALTGELEPALAGQRQIRLSGKPVKSGKKMRRTRNA